MKAAISVVEAICSNPLQHIMPKKRDIAPNAKSERQLRFFKTSHRKKPKINFGVRVQHSQHRLETIEAKFCAVCFSEEDEHGDSEQVQWIQCDKCTIWIRLSFVDMDIDVNETYVCTCCRVLSCL